MLQNSDELVSLADRIAFLTGSKEILSKVSYVPVMPAFCELAADFLDSVAKLLLADKNNRAYSDVVAWAFWIRKSSVLKEKQRSCYDNRLGRGLAFHVAPSNVPVNFAVSLTSSLLAGNISIVRVSSKDFAQVDIICRALNEVLKTEKFQSLAAYIIIVRYEHDKAINDYLSSLCDVRVVWGGNATVNELRQSPLPVRAVEMTFPDRYSLALINSDEYLKQDPKKIADLFYIDTYFSDQNACSSPRLIVWTGKSRAHAKDVFYKAIRERIAGDYQFSPILSVDKLDAFCRLAAVHPQVQKLSSDNLVVTVKLPELYLDVMDYKAGGGYFFDYDCDDLRDLLPILGKTCQTVSYLGIDPENLKELVITGGVRGVDRIVPLGHTMEIEFIWDGYFMVEQMSRA
ncbi:MAG TPA: long-chain-fatty-acyl-CoA reductase, partial [Succinivibrionaceae bacterium]|nr:long-chain-fatty-acyl-CoA reductase [Succinivibrionaceae bacterium]